MNESGMHGAETMEAAQGRPGRWNAGPSEAVAERGRLVIDAGGVTVGIFRLDGGLYAYESRCAHMGGPVCQGLLIPRVVELLDERKAIVGSRFHAEDLHIVCPWHGAEFDVRTGRHAGNKAMALRPVAVSEAEGQVYVHL